MGRCIDLHTHSSASDGADSPAALIAGAAEATLAAIALTDHDTLAGLDEAAAVAKEKGIVFVRGCELAAASPYGEVHLLGLWLPERPARLLAALARIREARDARNREMVERFRRAGYAVSYEELLHVAAGESVGRPHMARLLVQKGICVSIRDAFARFLGDDKGMYVPRQLPSLEEGLALLQQEGATTVLAHPMLLRAPFPALDAMVAHLAALGLDGVEVWHSEHDSAAVHKAAGLAERHKLAVSGGSDYHGKADDGVRLGRVWGNGTVPWSVLEGLAVRRRQRGLPVTAY